jgi:dipeptidyl aminopeptidase/acylaminoacyl peptidase
MAYQTSRHGSWDIGIWSEEACGLMPAEEGAQELDPAFHPRQDVIAYASNSDGSYNIVAREVAVTADGLRFGEPRTVASEDDMDESAPCWTADGSGIAYRTGAPGARTVDVRMQAIATGSAAEPDSEATLLAQELPGGSEFALLGTSGRALVYASGWELMYCTPAQPSGRALLQLDGLLSDVAASPDGTAIAFAERLLERKQEAIWVLKADELNSPQRCTPYMAGCGHPSWSDDGLLAFSAAEGPTAELVVRILRDPWDTDEQKGEQAVAGYRGEAPHWAPGSERLVFFGEPMYADSGVFFREAVVADVDQGTAVVVSQGRVLH